MGAQLGDRRRRGRIARPDERPDDLTPVLVGQADDRHLGDGGMAVEDLLDLGGEEVLAAADDHVLEPADDSAVAALVHVASSPVRSQPSARSVSAVASGMSK